MRRGYDPSDLPDAVREVTGEFRGLQEAVSMSSKGFGGLAGYIAKELAGPFGQMFNTALSAANRFNEQVVTGTLSDQIRLGGDLGTNYQANVFQAMRNLPVVGGAFQLEVDPYNLAAQDAMAYYAPLARQGFQFDDDFIRQDLEFRASQRRSEIEAEQQVQRLNNEQQAKSVRLWTVEAMRYIDLLLEFSGIQRGGISAMFGDLVPREGNNNFFGPAARLGYHILRAGTDAMLQDLQAPDDRPGWGGSGPQRRR